MPPTTAAASSPGPGCLAVIRTRRRRLRAGGGSCPRARSVLSGDRPTTTWRVQQSQSAAGARDARVPARSAFSSGVRRSADDDLARTAEPECGRRSRRAVPARSAFVRRSSGGGAARPDGPDTNWTGHEFRSPTAVFLFVSPLVAVGCSRAGELISNKQTLILVHFFFRVCAFSAFHVFTERRV